MTGEETEEPDAGAVGWRCVLVLGAIWGATVAAYWPGLDGPLVFDDGTAVRENPTIRTLWPPMEALSPPRNSGVGGRPLANLSFAVNYALGGIEPRGYRVTSLLLHLATAGLLFGLVRRTARGLRADWIAAGAAATWAMHPLTTGAVSYISQRTELLMGFCYVLALYAFARGWRALTLAACAFGMLCKEPMATAPVLVFLYDRTFVSGGFGAAWRARRGFYAALAATWLVLGWVLTTGLQERSVGFGLGVSGSEYALAACSAIVRYLQLAVWPAGLVFDYGRSYEVNVAAVVMVAAMLAATGWALARRPRVGFVAAGFFLLLAPTTSVVPVAEQPIAENRMYVPLALLCAGAVAGLARIRSGSASLVAAVVALAWCTAGRNAVYRSEVALWADTVAKRPGNARAHYNLGVGLLNRGEAERAAAVLAKAVALDPNHAEARNGLANARARMGDLAGAREHYEAAVQLRPDSAKAWHDFGSALLAVREAKSAREHLHRAVALRPDWAEARNSLGNAYFETGDAARAREHYEAALRLDPALVEARYNAGSACLELAQFGAAAAHFAAVARMKPHDAEVWNNLGVALLRSGRRDEAVQAFEDALRRRPDYADARENLAVARGGR